MSSFISFQDLKSQYPTMKALNVRVHGGVYGKDNPFDRTFTGNSSAQESSFPITFSCTNPTFREPCKGKFNIGPSIHHALKNSLPKFVPSADIFRGICDVMAPGMTQSCRNFCRLEIQAEYETIEEQ